MMGLKVGARHHDDGRGGDGLGIVGSLASDENAIADLEILKLQWSGVF